MLLVILVFVPLLAFSPILPPLVPPPAGRNRARAPDRSIRRVSLIETPASSKSALELAGVSISALYFLTVASSTQIGILGSRQ